MNETVLITGASSGIGLELARCFAADGSRLVLLARSTEALEKLAAELRQKFSSEVRVLTADLAQPGCAQKIFTELQAAGVTVDVLVNNAGFGAHGDFAVTSPARQSEMVQVNVLALQELTGLFLPGMLARGRGGVLNVASTAAFQPGPRMAVYYATKAFVVSFTEALAEETRGTGVTVTALCPGPTRTNFGNVANFRGSDGVLRAAMTAAAVAREGHAAFRSGRVLFINGWQNFIPMFLLRFFPRLVVRKVVKRLIAVRKPVRE